MLKLFELLKNLTISFVLILILSCNKSRNDFSNDDSSTIEFYLSKKDDSTLNYKHRQKLIDSAYKLAVKMPNNQKNRVLLSKISFVFFEEQQLNKFKESTNILLKKAKESNDTLMIAKSYRYFGSYYKDTRINDSSLFYYIKAKKIYKKYNLEDDYYNIIFFESIVKYNISDYIGADLSLRKAYNYFKKKNNLERLNPICTQLGLTNNELKEYEKAVVYFKESLKITSMSNNKYLKSLCYNNLGLVYNNSKEYNKAIENFKLALRNKTIHKDDPELYGHLLDNLGFSYLKLGSETNLPQLFYQSLKIRDSLGYDPAIIVSNNHLSEYYENKRDTVNALKFAKKALNIAIDSKDPHNKVLALKQASIVDKKNSSKYSEDYIRISDSLQLEERKNKDRFARIELETDELRQENTQLSEQNRDILNYFMIAIVFGGFLFFARFQRLKARELALKQTQQQANEEIYRLIISHQNQLEEGRDLEKKRISKELHDGVLGRLFGLRLNLDGLNNFDDDETKQQRLDYLNELKVIEQDLREISHELSRENLVLINNFVAIINNLLEQQTKINNAKINTLISDKIDWEKVSNTIKINLYRILQESLQNINKHAEAKTINIIFNKDSKGNLIFSIEDDGKGYNTNGKKTKGIGVNNIVERVHQCQGKIDIKSQIGKGTKIIITFPLENETINM